MYGDELKLSIAHQNSFGTPITNVGSFMAIPILSETLAIDKPPLEIANMRGVHDAGPTKEGLNSISGGFEAEVNPLSFGQLLKAAFGQPTSTKANSAAVYTHVYVPNSADFDQFAALRPVTILKDFGDGSSGDLFSDMLCSNLSMSIANGELLKVSAEFMGGKAGGLASLATTFEDISRAFTWDVSSVSLNNVAVEEVMDLTFTLDNALTNKHTLNTSKDPSRTKRDGFRTVVAEGTMLFETRSHYLSFKNQTEQNLKLTLKGSGSEISSGHSDAVTIECPTFKYDEFKPNGSGPGQIEVAIKGRGIFNVGSGHSCKVTLVNTKAAY